MAAVSMSVHLHQQRSMENYRLRSFSAVGRSSGAATSRSISSSSDSSGTNLREAGEEQPFGSPHEEGVSVALSRSSSVGAECDDKVFVAVGKDFKESRSTLMWVLKNIPAGITVVLLHVHRPSALIPIMGGRLRESQLTNHQVDSYRQIEREKMHKTLDEYRLTCSNAKIQVEILVIEMDDVAKGIIEVIARDQITRLVMGAAADKHYQKKMKSPKSKTACIVQKEALPYCKIWFICKENLICTREASIDDCTVLQSPSMTVSSRSTQFDLQRSISLSPVSAYSSKPQDLPQKSTSFGEMSCRAEASTSQSRRDVEDNSNSHSEGALMNYHQSYSSIILGNEEEMNKLSMNARLREEESDYGPRATQSLNETEADFQHSSTLTQMGQLNLNDDLYLQLERALQEAANLKDEGHEESRRRRKTEMELLDANRRAKASEFKYAKELKLRKETEATIEREKIEMIKLKNQRYEVLEELQKAHNMKLVLENQSRDSGLKIKDLEDKLLSAQHILQSLRRERDELQQERDDAIKELEKRRRTSNQESSSTLRPSSFSEFSYLELEQATLSFDKSHKVGEGGYGAVFKGILRQTPVAIKILHSESLQGHAEFHQEVDILSRIRHPHLVTLIGACSEAWALVYEFLPNGSLEDRLTCKDNSPPLSWRIRIQIIAEISSALVFLHSAKPRMVVHGDLKPGNILLDANLVSKLSDFGISRFLMQSSSTSMPYLNTAPKGTLPYMDPEFISTGELTPSSDIYSFGVIILRLLTGWPALGISNRVQDAVAKGKLQAILDSSAGEWPFAQAQQLTHLGLNCCEMNRKNRPDLVNEVWKVLKPLSDSLLLTSSPASSSVVHCNSIPSSFKCPLRQEIMRDPHLAADGFTYEGGALKQWFDSGHKTSPVTRIELPDQKMIPNHTLRIAIQEWLKQR